MAKTKEMWHKKLKRQPSTNDLRSTSFIDNKLQQINNFMIVTSSTTINQAQV